MIKTSRLLLGAVLLAGPGLVALAQVSIAPPPASATEPSTARAPVVVERPAAPAATGPASSLPSAQSVLEGLLNERPAAPPATMTAASTNPALTPTVEGVAPNEPKATRLREGQFIWKRTGRLVKDDKTGTFMFAFDSDGKGMSDPPMALLPSRLLMSMEDASDKGARPVKFTISGEVTEYRGKNYLFVQQMQAIRDLNQGLGG